MGPGDPGADPPDTDDTLVLLFLCCHPELTPASQTALTLRAVGGLTTAMARAPLGPYQLQAAIAATHAAAASAEDTDWHQVHALYKILERIAPNPMVTLNRAVALAEIDGPRAGLALLSTLDGDARMAGHHRLPAVRAHLLEKAGELPAAYEHYKLAARTTSSLAERRYLESRAFHINACGRPVPARPAARS